MTHEKHSIETRDGRADAYAFTPASGRGPWPGALIFLDARGIRPAFFEIGQRLADAGYYVLLPDLFYRSGPYEPPAASAFAENPEFRKQWFAKHSAPLTPDNVKSDTRAFPSDSAVHNPAAAERHWQSLLATFDSALKPARAAQ